ncbi:MAG: DUF4339 domain-containing protein [Akkermansiaceae bacterium]|nr:DUF4339 domain-containing protein [Akkermansiaceae bacterium]MCD8070494.1 DUF4339 domain-containing protein [Akkermansiaceae bacterium]
MRYYYDDGEGRKGPASARELRRLLEEGGLTPDSWIRPENSATWRRWADTEFEEDEAPRPGGFLSRLSAAQKAALAIACLLLLPLALAGLLLFLALKALRGLFQPAGRAG